MALERDANSGPIGALIDRGEERGCVDLKEVDELAKALELEDDDLGALYEQLHARHIELCDDCTRQDATWAHSAATCSPATSSCATTAPARTLPKRRSTTPTSRPSLRTRCSSS